MKVRIDRCKMATSDPSEYGYSAYVEGRDISKMVRDASHHTTMLDGQFNASWYSFAEATRPESICAMPQGWDRYDAWREHETRANVILMCLAKRLYPELATHNVWPSLWTSVDLPAGIPRHETRYVSIELEAVNAWLESLTPSLTSR